MHTRQLLPRTPSVADQGLSRAGNTGLAVTTIVCGKDGILAAARGKKCNFRVDGVNCS